MNLQRFMPAAAAIGLARSLTGLGIFLSVATLLAFFSHLWWPLEFFPPFRLQYLVILTVLFFGAAITHRSVHAIVFGVAALVNLFVIAPSFPCESATQNFDNDSRFRVATVNVASFNERYSLVSDFLRNTVPDIVLLVEVTPAWLRGLSKITRRYPHSVIVPRDDSYGLALFSVLPLENTRIVNVADIPVPSVITSVSIDQEDLTLIGTHLLAPPKKQDILGRNRQLAALRLITENIAGPMLLLGDLNVSPWSPHFRKLISGTRLRNTHCVRRSIGTWPAWLPPLSIPLDHCLITPELAILSRMTGPFVGSDHYPVIVDLVLVPPGDRADPAVCGLDRPVAGRV